MANTDIKWALEQFQARARAYDLAASYYDGKHRFMAASERFRQSFDLLFTRLSCNLCPAVVDAVRDRLKLTGFTAEQQSDEITNSILAVQRFNRFDVRAGRVHLNSLKLGDAYVIVWPDKDNNPVFYPNEARKVVVEYDGDVPGRVVRAARLWKHSDGRVRLNLYFPDRTEKYATSRREDDNLTILLTPNSFQPYAEESDGPGRFNSAIVRNPYGIVPVFHFPNNADIGEYGQSELANVYASQDALNKSLINVIVGSEQAAKVPRWATGLTVQENPVTGKKENPFKNDDFFATETEGAKFGQFQPADITQLLEEKRSWQTDIAIITGTPLHYFSPNGGTPPSGEALKTAEARLTAKVYDRQVMFGNAWEGAMQFALEIMGYGGVKLDAIWEDTTPRDETSVITNAISMKEKAGGSARQVWRERGYSEKEIDAIFAEAAEEQAAGIGVVAAQPAAQELQQGA